jgi:hypothetical protein
VSISEGFNAKAERTLAVKWVINWEAEAILSCSEQLRETMRQPLPSKKERKRAQRWKS